MEGLDLNPEDALTKGIAGLQLKDNGVLCLSATWPETAFALTNRYFLQYVRGEPVNALHGFNNQAHITDFVKMYVSIHDHK